MSLEVRLANLATRIATEVKAKAALVHTHVATTDLTATGTKNSTTFLRGDNTWATPPGGGGGGLVLSTVEINAGTVAKMQLVTTVTDAAVSPTSKVLAFQAGLAATGRQADENEMETFGVVAIPLAGSIKFSLTALRGSLLQGNVNVHYTIG